jgi:hypothetical protein
MALPKKRLYLRRLSHNKRLILIVGSIVCGHSAAVRKEFADDRRRLRKSVARPAPRARIALLGLATQVRMAAPPGKKRGSEHRLARPAIRLRLAGDHPEGRP